MSTDVSDRQTEGPPAVKPAAGARFEELDGIRGLAALAVVLFHYTTRMREIYPDYVPPYSFPYSQFGVGLFVVSGFVILLSLRNARSADEFVLSRFWRLFPAYWAAIVFTWLVLLVLPLPGRQVEPWHVLVNFTMLQEVFGVPHVDGVYWFICREVVFYGWMLALRQTFGLHRIVPACWAALGVSMLWSVTGRLGLRGDEISLFADRWLLAPYAHLFVAGIAAFQLRQPENRRGWNRLFAATLVCEAALPRGAGGMVGHLSLIHI